MRIFPARMRGVVLGVSANLLIASTAHAWTTEPTTVPAPVVPGPVSPPATMQGPTRKPAAETALREGQALMQSAKYVDAVVKLDLAIELEPSWSAPVRLRAEAFGALAERYAPSEAFLTSQAEDIERLLALEPGVEVATRHEKLLELRREAADANRKETRRRNMNKPMIIYIVANASMLISGALMTSFYAAGLTLDATGQKNYVYTGAAMLGVGAAMLPGSIALGVLAGRQVKRDSAVEELNAETGRKGPRIGVAPQFTPGGAGMGLSLRF